MPSRKLQKTARDATFPRARGSHVLIAGFVALSLSVMAGWLVLTGTNAPGDDVSVPMIRATGDLIPVAHSLEVVRAVRAASKR